MERKNLEFFSEQIDIFINGILYDNTTEFLAFKTEMLININTFLLPKYYEKNINILKSNIYENEEKNTKINKYHLRLMKDLKKYIKNLKEIDQTINFEEDKKEIIESLFIFLNPKTYEINKKILTERVEKQKRLTFPVLW